MLDGSNKEKLYYAAGGNIPSSVTGAAEISKVEVLRHDGPSQFPKQ